jgi:hypothetical protein
MRRLAAVLVAAAVLALLPVDARAQGFFSFFGGYSYDGAAGECPSVWSDCPNRPTGYGLAFGTVGKVFGFEQEYAWTSDFFGKGGDLESSKVTTLMSTVLVGAPLKVFHPYGSFGVGLMKASMQFVPSNLAEFSDTSWGYAYGGGLFLLFPAHLGVRFDYRRYRSSAEVPYVALVPRTGPFEFTRVTFGLVLH